MKRFFFSFLRMGFNWKYLLRLLKKGYWLTMIFTILVFIFWGSVIYFSISFSSTQVASRIENCKTFTPFIYHLKVCFTTRNCSTLLTLFVFLVIFTASQLHLAIMGHLIQGILLLNALEIIICVSSVIDIWCKKNPIIF